MPESSLTLQTRAAVPARSMSVALGRLSPLLVVTGLLASAAWMAAEAGGWRLAVLLLVGGGLGFALYRSGFGFAGPWRALLIKVKVNEENGKK